MIGWQEALEMQKTILLYRNMCSEVAPTQGLTTSGLMTGLFSSLFQSFWGAPVGESDEAITRVLDAAMSPMPVYWVDPEVEQTINIAAQSVPDVCPDSFVLPSPSGLVVFPHTNSDLMASLMWLPMTGEEATSTQGQKGYMIEEWREGLDLNIVALVGFTSWWELLIYANRSPKLVERLKPVIEKYRLPPPASRRAPMLPHFMYFLVGGEKDLSEWVGPQRATSREWMFAFWAFCEQRLLVPEAPPVPRQVRRRMQREGTEREISRVKVVTLRRLYNPSTNRAQKVDHDHRWMVRGHWRNQWFPRQQRHRLLWIHPHIKGPEDKPIVSKQTVFKVRR